MTKNTPGSSSTAQPQTLAQRLSRPSIRNSGIHTGSDAREVSEAEDQDRTPKPQHQTIGIKSSSETLKAKDSMAVASRTSTPLTTDSNTLSNTSSSTAVSNDKLDANLKELEDDPPLTSRRFGLGSKKKRQQRQAQEREERRLKEEANEALRKKHGEYHPPGHSQGQIHTHRPQRHHDHHQLERSRSRSNIKSSYPPSRSQSSIRVVSPEPRSLVSPSPTPSSTSSAYSSRQSSVSRGRSRPTSPIRDMVAIPIDFTNPHMSDLRDLDAEGMLSEHWETNSESEDEQDLEQRRKENRASRGYGRGKDHQRNTSVDTDSSYRTGNSSVVHFDLPPLSASSTASSRHSRRNRHSNQSRLSVDTDRTESQSPDRPQHVYVEMQEIGNPGHQSWQLKNMSTTGIVTGLSPEFDGQSVSRPHSSMSKHHSTRKSKDPLMERYLYHARPTSPTTSNVPSSASNHRPVSRQHHYHQHNHHYGSDRDRGALSDMSPSAIEAMRSKAGSRAAGTIRGGTTIGGSGDASSIYGTEASAADEHNYLAPLPPFQQGPAYTRVPKRKFCKWFFGGCRWWVLLLAILIPAGIIAAVTTFLLHKLTVCVAIDPNTVDPLVYEIDPDSVRGISLEYQTRTRGNINIIDSPNTTETRVLLKLQRQFYKMTRQDLVGFQVEVLSNNTLRYVLNDAADRHREFFMSTVLCSNSILTIEMPRTVPGRSELSVDAMIDQQDVYVNLDENVRRNTTWRFRGISNHNMFVQSLNINALSISYTANSPSTVTLASVIVQDRLSVVSVSGDIKASVGFSSPLSLTPPSSSNSTNITSTAPSTVNLNTLDGQIQLDMKAWNQSLTFQVNAPEVQLSKAGAVILPFGQRNGTTVNANGLVANAGPNAVSGTYQPAEFRDAHYSQPPYSSTSGTATATGTATGTRTASTATGILSRTTTKTVSTTGSAKTGTATSTATTTATPTGSLAPPPGPTLGAGGSNVPAQFIIQANKNVVVNFP
ncbi:hypothetical protein BC939DRAFT_501588 [Gamsiella multidivaricata]|uniref:uncharacterized protein n=1 Tax=Gamsiella multidivaricata TaxID=101098 RepID=UPI00221F2CA7|nr:uncharacterized protein BC939DRAFT_501588 [Gamsiella multidivaricata]KAG0367123.1 hypothetical protein BGZ54_004372 [Gamsiella multidivaricata]KAI7826932.1 hypothetical protein BC939DRAFT_501588 [Gamsiella multidivaricata]